MFRINIITSTAIAVAAATTTTTYVILVFILSFTFFLQQNFPLQITMNSDEKKMKKTACVTGATGYLASMLIKILLRKGYIVHATVRNLRDTAKFAHVATLQSVGELHLFQADLVIEESFDEAVAGCDYVFHVALPGSLNAEDPEKSLIEPTIEGTLNVLRSCAKVKSVKRVVCTSSAAAVSGNRLEGTGSTVVLVDEESWTDVEFLTTEKPPTWGYLAAKTLAEKKAMEFAEAKNVDLVTINPVLVVGSGLTPEPPLSLHLALSLLTGDEFWATGLKIMQKISGSISIVHIEDVCNAHVFAAENEAASGRYIVSKINTSMRELAAFLHQRYPRYKSSNLNDMPEKAKLSLSSEKIIKAGFQFKHEDLGQIYDEIIDYGKATGLLPKITEALSDSSGSDRLLV